MNNTYSIKSFKELVKSKHKFAELPKITKDYEIKQDGNKAVFKITDQTPDRENDVVFVKGIDINNYIKNPVVLWGHDASDLPIGKCINIEEIDNSLVATVEFVPEDYPYNGAKAETIRRAIEDGFLNAVSIGFIPKDWTFNEEGGIDILTSELTEFSIVSVPCNPEALVQERTLNTSEPLIPEQIEEEENLEENKKLNIEKKLKKIKFNNKRFNLKDK